MPKMTKATNACTAKREPGARSVSDDNFDID
jgi:hypothetical protein